MNVSRQAHAKPKAKSATRQMVGHSGSGERINPKWRKHFRRLLDLRDHLLKQQRDQFHDAMEERPAFSMHMADAATDSYDRDLALGMLSHEQDALYEIEEALNRVRKGTYGVCELTGRRISAARLEAIPWTRFTASAERTLEQKGTFPRAHLGSLENMRRNEPSAETDEEA